jgi:L-iditol 2-dehydrogenase
MKAAVYYGPGDIRVEDHPDPMPTAENLVVEVHCCAICGTDLKLATIGNPRCHPPRVIGHEMVGHIVHAGAKVKGFSRGDRVTLATTVACGDCPYCSLGLGNLCPNSTPISYDFDGAFADYLAVPPQALAGGNVIAVPEGVPDEAAALSEPLSCAVNAQEIAGVKQGDRVLVIGGGPLGALHAELAKALGAAVVMIVARSEPRLSMLRRLNHRVIDGSREDIGAAVADCTSGLGADVVIICAPSREAHEGALRYVRKGGTVSLFASLPKDAPEVTFDSRAVHYGELRIVGASDSRPEHVRRALEIIASGGIDLERIVTHRLSLDRLREGLELMKQKQCLKVMVYPRGVA